MADGSTDDGAAGPEEAHHPYAALAYRDFSIFLAASIIGTVGMEMQGAAVAWELYKRTGAPLALGWVGFVQVLPVILLSLPAGHVADRFRRRGVIMASQAVMVLASLGLARVSAAQGPVALIYGCLFLTGVAAAFAFPARWAFLPELVAPEDFHNAVTWRSSGWQIAAVLGPALAGYGIALADRLSRIYLIYLTDAAFGLVVLACLAVLRDAPRRREVEPFSWASLMAGVRFVARTDLILATITLDMFAVLLGGAVTLLPVFAKDILHVGASGYGWLRAAPAVGALAMALVLAHRPPFRRAGPVLIFAVCGFGASTIVFGLSRSFALSFVMLFLTGLFDNMSVVIRSTLLQALTPDALRGRVSAVNSVFIGMSNELGAFESGVAAQYLGTVRAVVLGGVGCIAVVLGVAARWPAVARLTSIQQAASAAERREAEAVA